MAEKYHPLFIGSVLALFGIVGLLIISPFVSPLLAAAVLAYVFYPVHWWLARRIWPSMSALVVTIFALLIITVPVIFVLNTATQELHYVYVRAKQRLLVDNLVGLDCPAEGGGILCSATRWLNDIASRDEVQSQIKQLLSNALTWFGKRASDIIVALPGLIIGFIVTIFTMFYLLLDGRELVRRMYRVLPIKLYHQRAIDERISDVVFATIYGSIIVALIQGALGGIGFWIFGIPSPVVWGMVMAFFALIPFVGTWIIWLPAALGLLLDGYADGSSGLIWRGALLLIYGLVIVSGIDNIIKPKIIGDRARVHPVIVMIGALGGLLAFGPVGFVVGPVTLALAITAFQIYEREKIPHLEKN